MGPQLFAVQQKVLQGGVEGKVTFCLGSWESSYTGPERQKEGTYLPLPYL